MAKITPDTRREQLKLAYADKKRFVRSLELQILRRSPMLGDIALNGYKDQLQAEQQLLRKLRAQMVRHGLLPNPKQKKVQEKLPWV